ncbi:hypothetical protein ACLOJK_006071 [Asimina triloba]
MDVFPISRTEHLLAMKCSTICPEMKKLSSYGAAEASSNFGGTGLSRGIGGMPGLSIGDPARMGGPGSVGPDVASNVRNTGYGGQVPLDPLGRSTHEMHLPPDASCTLFIEGLPPDSTQREVARYKFDEEDPDSPILRVQFARFPTRKSGPPRNKR